MVFNTEYLIYMLPALVLSLIAQFYVKSAYRKWSQVRNYLNITGADAAQRLFPALGLRDVTLQPARGTLSDHYDPRKNTLALSTGVANQPSVAALAITAHELGHAMQDKDNYLPLRLRSAIVPIVTIGSNFGWILIMIGLVLNLSGLAWAGVFAFSAGALFSLVTLPVEVNASKRAIAMLKENGLMIREDEEKSIRTVLNAATLTYVAALANSILQLLYFGGMVGRMNRRS